MNILTVAWNIYEEVGGHFQPGRNGFSVMVSNIAEYIGRVENSFVLIGDRPTDATAIRNVHLVETRTYLPQLRTKENIKEWHAGLIKSFCTAVRDYNVDFVFFHGIGDFIFNCIDVCKAQNIGFAVVLHGYYGWEAEDTDFGIPRAYLEKEDQLIRDTSLPLIVVSHGVKRNIIAKNHEIAPERVGVVVNGTEKEQLEEETTISVPFRKPKKRILSCVASFQPRKNQMQVVRAFCQLPKEIQQDLGIVFCGVDCRKPPYSRDVLREIEEKELKEDALLIGSLPPDQVKQLYHISDGIILPSLSEGLSVVVLESIMRGKPAIMFEDNETADDVNAPEATVLVSSKSDEDLAEGIKSWYMREWNPESIRQYAEQFCMERVAADYIDYVKNR